MVTAFRVGTRGSPLPVLALAALAALAIPSTLFAQPLDVIGQAKAFEKSGQRSEAVQVLRDGLVKAPGDDDVRKLLAAYLSWDAHYDEARALLSTVLDRRPTDTEALTSLVNVELWSGHLANAKTLAERGMLLPSEHDQFQDLKRRVLAAMAAARPWSLQTSYQRDSFSDGRTSWQETQVSLKRYTRPMTLIATAVQANRFGLRDRSYQLDLYPKFHQGSYAYVSVGYAPDPILFPRKRIGADLYQAVGFGLEASVGFRRLQFDTTTTYYQGAMSKYAGDWMLTARMYVVPDRAGASSRSYQGAVRRYFGRDGSSYIGARYGKGFARTEITSVSDLDVLQSTTFAAEADVAVLGRWRLSLQGMSSREDRATGGSLRQNTVTTALGIRFK